jgi:hypothetical protein
MTDHPPAKRSPQEKKKLSYAKDRRNVYGENDKASRKNIPKRKAAESRKDRRKVGQSLSAVPRLDEATVDIVESSARNDVERIGGWRKSPDQPLAEYLGRKRTRANALVSRRAAKALAKGE